MIFGLISKQLLIYTSQITPKNLNFSTKDALYFLSKNTKINSNMKLSLVLKNQMSLNMHFLFTLKCTQDTKQDKTIKQ